MKENPATEELAEFLMNFHFPTWEELPPFEVYMDQVLTIVNSYLGPLISKENQLTASMVNNYVKQKLLPPPVKKKYVKEHLAFLMVINLMKQVFTLPEIKVALRYQLALQPKQEAYVTFCQMQEQSFKEIALELQERKSHELKLDVTKENTVFLRSLTLSLALKIYSKILMNSVDIDDKGEPYE